MGAQKAVLDKTEGSFEGGAIVEQLVLSNTCCLVSLTNRGPGHLKSVLVKEKQRRQYVLVNLLFLQERLKEMRPCQTQAAMGGARPHFKRMVHKERLCPCHVSLCLCKCFSVGLFVNEKDQLGCQVGVMADASYIGGGVCVCLCAGYLFGGGEHAQTVYRRRCGCV